jgi:hypothetical protein
MIQKSLLLCLLFLPIVVFCQKGAEKADQLMASKLKYDIEYLASDELQGRYVGSRGEQLAADHITKRFNDLGIAPYQAKYQWDFIIKNGIKVGSFAYFKVNDTKLVIGADVIQMPYSHGDKIRGAALPFVDEANNVWMISMKAIKADISNAPFKLLYEKAKDCIAHGATSVIFFNDVDATKDINVINHPSYESLTAPVVVINHKAYQSVIKPNMKKDWIDIDAKLGYEDANLTAKNVAAMIDNNAPLTIVLTATYDYLGVNGAIYNGANNNASGVASLLALAEMIKTNDLKRYNFLFLALSGSTFDDAGAKEFLKENSNNISSFSSLIDLNMLGRFNKISKALFVNGVGTSPIWGSLLQSNNKAFVLNVDSAGVGYGAYSFFYKKNIPLLSFNTGYNSDYAKPSDDADKINYASQVDINNMIYKIICDLERQARPPVFTETFNMAEKLESLKSNIGIVPDYSFTEDGIRIAFCVTNKTADKAGLLADDIILQLAEFPIIDFDDYMLAMNKLQKGREIPVTVKRGKNEFKFFVVL